MSLTVVRARDRRRVKLGRSLGRGGEGEVFVADGGHEVAKIYWPGNRGQAIERKLGVMAANPPRDPMKSKGHLSLAWPTEIVLSRGKFAGFLMPYLDTKRYRPLHQIYRPTSFPAGLDWSLLVQTARNLAAALDALHGARYIAGDLNESNVLAATNTVVAFVDCDSMQVPDRARGRVYRCTVGKPEYTAPELQGKDFSQIDRTLASDRFALAVLICQLLVRGRHPFSGRPPHSIAENISVGRTFFSTGFSSAPGAMPPPDFLPPGIQGLFRRAFVDGQTSPARRPSAREWQQELDSVRRLIRTCSVEPSHKYSAHLPACPWCLFERQHGLPAFPTSSGARRLGTMGGRRRTAPAPKPAVRPAGVPPATLRTSPLPGPTFGGSPGLAVWTGSTASLRRARKSLARKVRHAAVGCLLGLLLTVGAVVALVALSKGGSPASGVAPAHQSSPTGPPASQPPVNASQGAQPSPEDTLLQDPASRKDPGSWDRLAASYDGRGLDRLARSARSLAQALRSEIPSAVRWDEGPRVLNLLRTLGLTDDEWLGDAGDRAAEQGRKESSQALYYLAQCLDSTDREWLRKIEPRTGLEVRRGMDWRSAYGSQDGGDGSKGLVTAVPPTTPRGWVEVRWQAGSSKNWYRWGADGKYELGLAVPWDGSSG